MGLEKVAEQLVEVFESMPSNGFRGLNLCAPISFRTFEMADLFKKTISYGKYPLEIAEGGINPIIDYFGERKNVVIRYSVPVKYIKPQKNGNGGGKYLL